MGRNLATARNIFLAAVVVAAAGCSARAVARDGDRADRAVILASAVVTPRVAAPAPRDASDDTDVLTAHNDTARTGWNAHETRLTVANVNAHSFGKLFDVPVDGQVFAQPLVVTNVAVPGIGPRNLLFIATEHDSVYAVDADSGRMYWKHSFGACCGVSAVAAPQQLDGCNTVAPFVGISATPVIDRRTNTMYVVATTAEAHGASPLFHATLYALSIATGADRAPPAEITQTVQLSTRGTFTPGSSFTHSVSRYIKGGWLTFDAQAQFSRPGLLLANGAVYAAFSSHCERSDAHGWIFAYDASTLRKRGAFTTVGDWHDVNGGGIWQSGFGITADPAGHVYVTTGDGPFDADTGGRDFGDSLLEFTPDLAQVRDYYTPSTAQELYQNDSDFSGGAMVVLPDRSGRYGRLGVVTGKPRALVLVNRDHLGGYTPGGPDAVLQTIGSMHDLSRWCLGTCGGPAYYAGPRGEFIYAAWSQDSLRAFRLDRNAPVPHLTEVAHSPDVFPGLGGTTPSVSSNGNRDGTAIVWATTRPARDIMATQPIRLIAFDARDISHVLYTGDATLWRNPHGVPFLTPTIANGKVYVGGDHDVSVFGLLR